MRFGFRFNAPTLVGRRENESFDKRADALLSDAAENIFLRSSLFIPAMSTLSSESVGTPTGTDAGVGHDSFGFSSVVGAFVFDSVGVGVTLALSTDDLSEEEDGAAEFGASTTSLFADGVSRLGGRKGSSSTSKVATNVAKEHIEVNEMTQLYRTRCNRLVAVK